jgi:hypothetical protein
MDIADLVVLLIQVFTQIKSREFVKAAQITVKIAWVNIIY